MKVKVKLFAVARQLAGREFVDVELPEPATIGQLRQTLGATVPELTSIAEHVMFAVGTEYADDRAAINAGAEVACIPPVSGG